METFEEKINGVVDSVVMEFIKEVSSKYKLSNSELVGMWKRKETDKKEKEVIDYEKMKKKELVDICKEMKISDKGNKGELIKRIKNKKEKGDDIVEKLDMSLNSIIIKKNKFGNYLHVPTNFVFDKNNKSVIGKEIEDGNILPLTKSDINICNKYKFKYNVPEDLNENKDEEDDEIVEESEDEEDEEDEDEEDDELES